MRTVNNSYAAFEDGIGASIIAVVALVGTMFLDEVVHNVIPIFDSGKFEGVKSAF